MHEEPYDPLLLSRRRSVAQQHGVSDRELRSSGLWVRDLHGVVRPSFVEHDPTVTRVSNAVALMSDANALGGWAALFAQGNTWFDGSGPDGGPMPVLIHCLPGSQLRKRPGVLPSEGRLRPAELLHLGGYRVTTPARAVFDEMCRAPGLREAVVVAELVLSTTNETPSVTRGAIAEVVTAHPKVRGVVRARRALEMASTRSASPGETRTRMLAQLDANLSCLLVNQPVFDLRGTLLGVADLLDPATGLVIESDGLVFHRGDLTAQNHRQERLQRHGLVVCRVTSSDLRHPDATAARLRLAQQDAARRHQRAWTTELPPWWSTWPPGRRWD